MATPKELKVEIIDFWAGYNPKTNRYDNVTFGIQNVGESEEVSATITIQLYDVNNTIIASGEKELPSTLKVNTNFNVNVELSWVKNATLTDYAKGRIIIS